MKLLLIDDDMEIKSRFDDAIALWNDKHCEDDAFQLECIFDFAEAKRKLIEENLSQYDGLIVDLIFKSETKGDELVKAVNTRLIRVPTVVHTATSDPVDGVFVKIFKKGESRADKILEWFQLVRKSGVMSVVGLQGCIERQLKDIFDRFQLYSLERWAKLGRDKGEEVARRSATRYVLMHLLDALDCDDDVVYPDEMYLRVDAADTLKTGDVVKRTVDGKGLYHVVMSPACDLALHDNVPKSDSVLLVKMISIKDAFARELSAEKEKWKKEGGTDLKISDHEKKFWNRKSNERIKRKGHYAYLHPIPSVQGVDCHYIAFRHVLSVPHAEVLSNYARTGWRIAPPFLKDIQSRFAAYYGRQGHPDVDFALEE